MVLAIFLKEMLAITSWIVLFGMTYSDSHATGNRSAISSPAETLTAKALELYNRIDFSQHQQLRKEVFVKAYTGYKNLNKNGMIQGSKNMLSICDFALSSKEPRLWVIDLDSAKVLFNIHVAHGAGTGEEYARNFSNRPNSHQSSLGFYLTGNTYQGGNGYSLRLYGMDTGYNDRAAERAIVMHGAPYVSEHFVKSNNRIGRSWGCPAIPQAMTMPVINTIKNGTCLFLFSDNQEYLKASKWLKAYPAESIPHGVLPIPNNAQSDQEPHQMDEAAEAKLNG